MLDATIARLKMRQAKRYLQDSQFDAWVLLTREG